MDYVKPLDGFKVDKNIEDLYKRLAEKDKEIEELKRRLSHVVNVGFDEIDKNTDEFSYKLYKLNKLWQKRFEFIKRELVNLRGKEDITAYDIDQIFEILDEAQNKEFKTKVKERK